MSGLPTSVASSSSPPSQDGEVATVRFGGIEELFEQVDSTPGDMLIVTHVTPQIFAEIERTRDIRRRRFRFHYYANRRMLTIAMQTLCHVQLHIEIYMPFFSMVCDMGLKTHWKTMGMTTYRVGDDSGEADSSGGSRPARTRPHGWPTLVIESGHSGSLAQLRTGMDWWFSASSHDVKVVILAKLHLRRREIVIERWEEELPISERLGAATTRAAAELRPVRRQEILITQNPMNPRSYDFVNAPLILPFGLLFLRDPDPAVGEGDFIMDIPQLQDYAERVWEAMED